MTSPSPDPFVPLPRWAGGHRMTVYCWARPRSFPRLPPPAPRWFDVGAPERSGASGPPRATALGGAQPLDFARGALSAVEGQGPPPMAGEDAPNARVLAHCHWHTPARRRPTLLALHGLEGSSSAHYMRGLADKFFHAGFNVVRLNQQNCGGTERLSAGLYHSGLTNDPVRVMQELIELDGIKAIAVAGYSLGGNLALKLAGEYGDAPPPELKAVCAVSPVMDLARCVDALERRENAIYEWNFVRSLKRRIRKKARLFPGRFPIDRLGEVRTVRMFDELFTAPHHGFDGASDYYHRASAMRVIDRVRVPALIISAEDDPFVPPEPFRDPLVTGNPNITVLLTEHGGHCGFAGEPRNGDDGYWAETAILGYVRARI